MRRAAKHGTGNELPRDALAWLRVEEPRDGKGKHSSGEEMSGGGLGKQREGFVKQRRGKDKQRTGYAEESEGTEEVRNATAQERRQGSGERCMEPHSPGIAPACKGSGATPRLSSDQLRRGTTDRKTEGTDR